MQIVGGIHGAQSEAVVGGAFAALRLARSRLRGGCRSDHSSRRLSGVGIQDVEVLGRLPRLSKGQPEVQQLQSLCGAIVLQERGRSCQCKRLVQDLGEEGLEASGKASSSHGARMLMPLLATGRRLAKADDRWLGRTNYNNNE